MLLVKASKISSYGLATKENWNWGGKCISTDKLADTLVKVQ